MSDTTRIIGLDGQDITSLSDWMDYYAGHLDEARFAFRAAFLAARADCLTLGGLAAASIDQFYLTGLEVDGQYHTVHIGVGNMTDITVEVDPTCNYKATILRNGFRR